MLPYWTPARQNRRPHRKGEQIVTMEQSAEEAAHTRARAVVDGDYGTMIRGMTPEALGKAMQVGKATLIVTAYDLTSQACDGDDYLFHITYETDLGPLTLRERFREIDGEWKMVDIDRIA